MNRLTDHFDRIAVISLPHREERRMRLVANLEENSLADSGEIQWVEAVDGSRTEIPEWAKMGAAAWGCRHSHLKILKQAREDKVENLLILEDDAFFHSQAGENLGKLMPLLPSNWDLFFIGGQHLKSPEPTEHPAILKGTFITRTHAYAIPRRFLDTLIEHVGDEGDYRANPQMHLDHQYGYYQDEGAWNAYAPSWWIAGQEEGKSDISALDDPRRWWHDPNQCWSLPFVMVPEVLKNHSLLYEEPTSFPEGNRASLAWMRNVASEALLRGQLPAYPMKKKRTGEFWPGGVKQADSFLELEALADYAHQRLTQSLIKNRI